MIIMKDDSINRQVAIDAFYEMASDIDHLCTVGDYVHVLEMLPSAQPNLYGYDIEHLALIARLLQKENLSPERVAEALIDIGKVVAIVKDEFEETLRNAMTMWDGRAKQPNWCDGCKWEYAFGYGECHHCKRSYNDMYEVKDEG